MLPSLTTSFVVLVMMIRLSDTGRSQSCLSRCEFEISDTHELLVYAEDILSFQRFFDPRLLGDSQRELTSVRVWCSQALLGETVLPFQPAWAALAPRLLRLQIQGCRIMALAPRAFGGFHNLTSLAIDNREEGSPFMVSERGLEGLRNLASFRLTGARLRSVDRGLFHRDVRHNLMKVYLSHNSLVGIDKLAVCGMPRLSDLDLSFNKLVGNETEFLRCISSLYLLNVSHNAIQRLESDAFKQNRMLHTLDLSHNRVHVISTAVKLINTTKSLREVYLAGNPWKCNVTSLFQLHSLVARSNLQIVDWKSLSCVQEGGERVLFQDVIFPYAFDRLLKAWPMFLVVMGILACLCSLLALKCHLDHLNVSVWHWLQMNLLRISGRRRAADSSPFKMPQPPTCVSVVQCLEEEEEEDALSSNVGQLVADEKRNGRTEALIEKALNDIHRKAQVAESFSKQCAGERKNRVAALRRVEDEREPSYVSYKTRLFDPEAYPAKASPISPLGAPGDEGAGTMAAEPREGDLGSWRDGGAPETKEVKGPQSDERGADPTLEGCDGPGGTDLHLSTSAGVATTPTETQTMAMAGVRGMTHYTLASWLTVERPHLTTKPAPVASRSPKHLPPPQEHLETKGRRETVSEPLAFHPSPPLPVPSDLGARESLGNQAHQQPPSVPTQERPSRRLHTHPHQRRPDSIQRPVARLPPSGRQGRPAAGKDLSPGAWDTGLFSMANTCGQMVCGACLAALSLPDVHSSGVALYGRALGPGSSSAPPTARTEASTSLRRRRRFAQSGSAEGYGPSDRASDKWPTFANKSADHPSEEPVYQSLERGTKRRPLDALHDAKQRPYEHLSLDASDAVGSPSLEEGAKSSSADNSLVMRIDGQRCEHSEAEATDQFPGGGKKCQTPSVCHVNDDGQSALRRAERKPSAGNVFKPAPEGQDDPREEQRSDSSAPGAVSTGGASSASPSRSPAPRGQTLSCCRCGDYRCPRCRSGVFCDGRGADGVNCDVDIEAQATQIIDMVELHAQSPCKPS